MNLRKKYRTRNERVKKTKKQVYSGGQDRTNGEERASPSVPRWSNVVIDWTPHDLKRKRGHQKKRWSEMLKLLAGPPAGGELLGSGMFGRSGRNSSPNRASRVEA